LGAALTARLLLLALAGGYVVLLCAWLDHLERRGRAWFGALGVTLALGLACTWAAADHAVVGLQPALALPVDVVHLLTMGLWLGGLVTLVVILRPAGTTNTEAPPERAVYRFSSIATGSIVTLIGTGSYQSWRQLGSWAAFGSTDYGRLLLMKLGAFALLLCVALRSHRATQSTLRRSVLAEAALGAVVLGITAMLVNAEPGRTATTAPQGRPITSSAMTPAGATGEDSSLWTSIRPPPGRTRFASPSKTSTGPLMTRPNCAARSLCGSSVHSRLRLRTPHRVNTSPRQCNFPQRDVAAHRDRSNLRDR